MSDQINQTTKTKRQPQGRKRRIWLRILLWALVIIFFVVACALLILWVNRYSLIEQQARKQLEKAGIEATFNIEQIDKSKAIINDLKLSDEDGPFLSAEKLTVSYRFKEVRAGKVDKITLKTPVLRLTLDGSGNVIDRWVPEGADNSDPISFPRDGIFIENGTVNWAAPWGAGSADIDADISSETEWLSQINMPSARFARNGIEFNFGYEGNLDRKSEYELVINGQINSPAARVLDSEIGRWLTDFDLNLATTENADQLSIDGRFDLDVKDAHLPKFAIGEGRLNLNLDANYSFEDGKFDQALANWSLTGESLSVVDPAFRENLIRRTMSYNALSNTPIAMHFADGFERNGKKFFEEFSVNGSGRYAHNLTGYQVEFDRPVGLTSAGQSISLIPGERPEISYRSKASQIDLNINVEWDGARDLILRNLNVTANSNNGLVLDSVDRVSANIISSDTWRRTINQQSFRLSPLDIDLDYDNTPQGGIVNLRGEVDYDGELPGGYARQLKVGGAVVVQTNGEAFTLSFNPKTRIEMTEFTSMTGWRGENISFDLVDGKKVLQRTRYGQPFRAILNNVSADIASPENDRHLQTQFNAMSVASDFSKKPQIWDLDVVGIAMQSDNFPSPGTDIQSQTGTAKFTQYTDGSIEFVVISPDTKISTDNVRVADLFIEMAGRPDDFSARYKAGAVQLKGGEIPVVPMDGTARLQDGILTGNAVAPMPKTVNTPINIEYRSEDGIGSAHISIPKVVFTPRGLQPQYLIPALRGKLAEVRGEASAEFNFSFGDGGPVRSSGSTTLKDMDIGTLVGPASGVTAEFNFKSMFPLETDGVQTAQLAGFDAGIPLENGTIKFEIVPNGIRIDQAFWPVASDADGGGRIYISPMLWRFGNVENQAVVNIENLSLGKILQGVGNGSLSATGQINGRLPATVNGVDVMIENGVLAIKDGGVIQYRNQGIDTFAKDAKSPAYLGEEFAGSETGFAFKALENFEYKELEALIDGPLDGEMTLRMLFGGKNPDLLAGTAFEFDVSVSGELGNIARDSAGAFDAQKHLDTIVDMRRNGEEKTE